MKRNNLILIPIPLLILAVFPMPYSFYGTLRAIVCVAACFLTERHYRRTRDWNGWALTFICIALLFNPIIPVELSRATWFIPDLVVAAIFYFEWLRSGEPVAPTLPVAGDEEKKADQQVTGL